MLNNKIKTTAQRKHRQSPVDFIKTEALRLGACSKIRQAKTAQDLVELLFTPQGLEFASEKGFPTADLIIQCYKRCPSLRQSAALFSASPQSQEQTYRLGDRTIIMGNSERFIFEATETIFVHRIILVGGGTLRLRMADYAIVKLTQVGGKGNIINLTPAERSNARLIIE